MPTMLLSTFALDVLYVNVWTILVSLINLLLIFLILKKFLFKPVVKVVSEREAQAKGLISDAEKAKEEALQNKEKYNQKLANAEEEAQDIIRKANATANRQSQEILNDARVKANEYMEQASNEIEQEKKKAINDLKDDLSSISLEIAEKVVGRELKEEDHKELIETFISELGDDNE